MSLNLRIATAGVFAIALSIVLIAMACGSGPAQENTPTPTETPQSLTPTATPSVTPTATAEPTNPPTVEVDYGPELEALAAEDIVTPICVPADPNGSSSVGTAPGAPPTPTPPAGERDPQVVAAEVEAYLDKATPVIEHIMSWESWLNLRWAEDLSAENQTAILHAVGIKTALACNAIALQAPVPPEAVESYLAISGASEDRLSWIKKAADELRAGGSGQTPELLADYNETSSAFDQAYSEFDGLREQHNVPAASGYDLLEPVLSVELTVPGGWFASLEGLNLVVSAPPEEGGTKLADLGSDSWLLGTSVRVRRLRNSTTLTASEASERFSGLVSRQGTVISTSVVTIDGLEALRHRLNSPDGWNATMTVVAAGQFTYFIETGCSTEVAEGCENAIAVVDSARFPQS